MSVVWLEFPAGWPVPEKEGIGDKVQFLKDFLVSRKAQALLLLVGIVLFGESVGLTTGQVDLSANGIMAYILGRGLADITKK